MYRLALVLAFPLLIVGALLLLQNLAWAAPYKPASTLRDTDNNPSSQPTTGPAAQGANMTRKAIFAAGCFWGVEALFRQVEGVTSTQVGYTGGTLAKPTYEDVCSDSTGHAEAVLVEYDPAIVSYDKLLNIFWENHDPTTPNRQGPDFGSQYRSEIFYFDDDQKKVAEASRDALAKSGKYSRPIVTLIEPAQTFWPAEEYHQRYVEKHPGTFCHILP
jgi:peptide-methionine (S)-S-oxide reductase